MRLLPYLLGAAALCGCTDSKYMGGSYDLAGADLAGADLSKSGGDMAMGGGNIPSPGAGNAVDNNFGDTEPNDTPQQATPLGTSMFAGINVWVTSNSLGGGDTADYFVFNSGAMGGPFSFNICSLNGTSPTFTGATLWQVQNNQMVTPPVHMWTGTTGCISSAAGDATLTPNTEYLFGLFGSGATGMYAA
jgi:hypothetical protein